MSDWTQQTGLRVQLQDVSDSCDASAAPGVCGSGSLLNQLDGFSVNPRLMVCFSGPVDRGTLQAGISLAPVNGGAAITLNQIIYEPTRHCAFAKPNTVLDQQTQYLLTVSPQVLDSTGQPVAADPAFLTCLNRGDSHADAYCMSLSKTLGMHPKNIVAASVFTTMSATAWLEHARTFIRLDPYPAATSTTFDLASVQDLTWVPQDNTGSTAHQVTIPVGVLAGVGKIAFGAFWSSNFLSPADGTILTLPTKLPISIPYFDIPVSFHVFLPAGAKPANGYPVVIYGHGLGDSQFGAPSYIASTLAQNGFATLAFEIPGHGYGPASVMRVTAQGGAVTNVPTPGRGVQLPGKTTIGATDGCILPGAIAIRDCARQSAADLFALVKAIQSSPDLNLDSTRIYYVGQSFGGTYGTLFHAVEPGVKTAVLNGAGGPSVDIARLAISGRSLGFFYLAALGLLNVPPAPPEAYFNDHFNDEYIYRNVPAAEHNLAITGAMPIQAAFEAAEWLGMLGDPLAYAPHLKTAPLMGVPAKSTLFQLGLGDLEVPNPTESAVIRAAGAQSSAWLFRFDRAFSSGHPELLGISTPDVAPLPILPHRILSNPSIFAVPAEKSIALAEQRQVAAYFQSNGASNPDPNTYLTSPYTPGMGLFEVPAALPEQLNFFQIQPH